LYRLLQFFIYIFIYLKKKYIYIFFYLFDFFFLDYCCSWVWSSSGGTTRVWTNKLLENGARSKALAWRIPGTSKQALN
jgi:hypothetical protein